MMAGPTRYVVRFGVAATFLMVATMAPAQGITPEDVINIGNSIQQEQARERAEQNARRQDLEAPTGTDRPAPADPARYTPPPGGPCFDIKRIDLRGFEAFKTRPDGYQDLVGRCVTALDIAQALNRINAHYQNLGFITTRAYVPEQSLLDGTLEITIVPGRIEGYVYGTGDAADARLNTAFPTGRGDLLNLRDLEQGLDNINAPRSASGQFLLVPGEAEGGSFVQVDVTDQKPWRLSLQLDNSGFDSTGEIKATSRYELDNGFGLNDQLRVDLTSTPFESRGDRYSDSLALNWGVPVGNWRFNADLGAGRYRFNTQGINQSFVTEGRSQYLILLGERLLRRTQTSKFYAYGDLKLNRSRTSINGIDISSQRSRLTVASLGLRGERFFDQGGQLNWTVGVKAGLDALGADIPEDSIIDQEFRLITLRADYTQPIAKTGLTYRSALVGQYTDDVLPGIEQFGAGSWSTVRGFHDNSLYGDTGAYLRNTLEWDAYKTSGFELRLSAGLDFGYVRPGTLRRWSQDHLVGVSLGADMSFGPNAVLQVQLAHALSRPEESLPDTQPAFDSDQTIGYVSLRVQF